MDYFYPLHTSEACPVFLIVITRVLLKYFKLFLELLNQPQGISQTLVLNSVFLCLPYLKMSNPYIAGKKKANIFMGMLHFCSHETVEMWNTLESKIWYQTAQSGHFCCSMH